MITSVDQKKCTGCGTCVKSCTLDVFALSTNQEELAPCMAACPCGVDVRGIVSLVQQDKLEEALALLKERMPFPALSSRLCTHVCETSCLRQPEAESVNILGMEHFLAGLDMQQEEEEVPSRHLARVAVIGGGIAGMAGAYFLCRQGYPVTLFEKTSHLGGSLTMIPQSHIPKEVLEIYTHKLKALGVEIRCNTAVAPDGDLTWEELINCGFKAALLATGENSQWGIQEVDTVTLQGHDRRMYAAGGCIGTTRFEVAIGQSWHAALSIERYLQGEDFLIGRGNCRPLVSLLPPALPVRSGFKHRRSAGGQPDTLSLEELQREALRCLTCGSKAYLAHTDDCMTCFTCEMNCPAGAITVHPFKEVLPRSLELVERRK